MDEFRSMIEKKQYKQALELLEAHKANLKEESYLFNKAKVFEHKDDYIQARYYYEKSMDAGLKEKDIDIALNRVYDELEVSYLESSDNVLDYYFNSSVSMPASFGLFLCLVLIILGAYLSKGLNKFYRIAVMLLIMLPIIGSLFIRSEYQYGLAKGDIALYLGPSYSMEKIIDLPAGLKVLVKKKTQSGWAEIYHPEEFKGWVQIKQLLLY